MNQSIGFSPAAVTRTRICPGPACGAGTSRSFRSSGPPNDSNWTARPVIADVLTLACCILTCLLGTAVNQILDLTWPMPPLTKIFGKSLFVAEGASGLTHRLQVFEAN